MNILKNMRKALNIFGYDFCKVGKKRLGRNLDIDLKAIINPHGNIFDVGANTGRAARHLRSLFPLSVIWSFEPTRESYEILRNEMSSSKNKVYNFALGSNDGTALLHKFHGSELNSLLAKASNSDLFIDPVSIREAGLEDVFVKTIDSVAQENAILQISLLKIDTQGYELEVLKGAANLLSNKDIKAIFLEVNFISLYQDQPSFGEILDYLSKFGYGLIGLYDCNRNQNGCIKWCDALFYPL